MSVTPYHHTLTSPMSTPVDPFVGQPLWPTQEDQLVELRAQLDRIEGKLDRLLDRQISHELRADYERLTAAWRRDRGQRG